MLLQRLWRLWPQQPLRAIANNVSSACQSVLPHEGTVLVDSRACRGISNVTACALRPWSSHAPLIHSLQPIQQLVVTASGPDRPGIVARLSKQVLECGGNVAESRMTRLAGDFTILMLITFDIATARKAEQLRNSLLEIDGLQVGTRWTSDERMKETQPLRKFRKILLRGADNPGLVYNVTEYLFSHGINIENLETHTEQAPSGGATLFMMAGVIAMPVRLSTRKLIHNLDTLQTTLGVDIAISNLPVSTSYKFRLPSPPQAIV
ncbi:unnamed protein product [Sphagnum jensenii]|uniref:ACT domain-containing protein n=1 Tax=Sphagnum jensenii TaxID=128206 RepID=A0ABP1BUE1_9BRYO